MPSGAARAVRPPSLVAIATLAALGIACQSPRPGRDDGGRNGQVTTTAPREGPFDASLVPAYAGSHPGPYGWIDAHLTTHLGNVRRWVRQRSDRTNRVGLRRMASMVRDDLRRLGFRETEIVETGGAPAVWAYFNAHAARSLVVYLTYDVTGADSAAWSVPPFGGRLVDRDVGRVLVSRGAAGGKGAGRVFLNALEAIIRSEGSLPVNVMVVAEGEHDEGSPHLAEVLDRYADRLRGAMGVLVPASLQDATGTVSEALGAQGLLQLRLAAGRVREAVPGGGAMPGRPGRAATSGGFAVAGGTPAWHLAQALACLTSQDGDSVTVPGWYDAIRPPSREEQRLIDGLLDPWAGGAPEQPVDEGDDATAVPATRALLTARLFSSSLRLDDVEVRDSGAAPGSTPPDEATAILEARLVPDQEPDSALALIRRHLDAEGFRDVSVHRLSGYAAAQVSDTASIVRATLSVYNKYSLRTRVAPRRTGSAPYALFTTRLGLPLVMGGLGFGAGNDAPDESLVVTPAKGSTIAGLREIEKAYVDLVYAIAASR